MELKTGQSSNHDFLDDLPHGVKEANATVIPPPLLEGVRSPHLTHLSRHGATVPGCLYQRYEQPPAIPCVLFTVLCLLTSYAT
jgi:hypothetical protein